jgi:hypothetical protein
MRISSVAAPSMNCWISAQTPHRLIAQDQCLAHNIPRGTDLHLPKDWPGRPSLRAKDLLAVYIRSIGEVAAPRFPIPRLSNAHILIALKPGFSLPACALPDGGVQNRTVMEP